MSQINNLKDRVLKKKSRVTELTNIIELIREFNCLSDIIGRDFEIKDKHGNLVYTIRQKPISIKQTNTLLEELYVLKKLDEEKEVAKWKK